MKSWFPEKGERWIFMVEIESSRSDSGRSYVCYRPIYMQQAGAARELDEATFTQVFKPRESGVNIPFPGTVWELGVVVQNVDKRALTIDYVHLGKDGQPASDPRRMSIHVFRASFRRIEIPSMSDSLDDRKVWQSSHSAPKRGGWYTMSVKIIGKIESPEKTVIKYKTAGNEQVSAPRLLEEKIFRSVFEPIDGAVAELNEGDDWFMMVEVTDYDPEEFSVWYRPITSSGERKGAIRHLSDYIFLATFKPAR
jgi:hypothetical protein